MRVVKSKAITIRYVMSNEVYNLIFRLCSLQSIDSVALFCFSQNSTFYKNCKYVESHHGKVTEVGCQWDCGFKPWWFLLVVSVVVAVMFLNDTASVIVILRYLKISFFPINI